MQSTARSLGAAHPLFADRNLLEEVSKVMYAVIQKTLHKRRSPSRQGAGPDRALIGGVSADDVLQEALIELWNYPPKKLTKSWGALGVTVARRRAVDAVRAARKGLRGTDHRQEIKRESGDAPMVGPDGEPGATRWDLHADERLNPEDEYMILRSVLDLLELAREVLDTGRDLTIFLGIRFQERTRAALAAELDLSPQRVGQIYDKACRTLEAHPRYPHDLGL